MGKGARIAVVLVAGAWACGGHTGGGLYSSAIDYRPVAATPAPGSPAVSIRVENHRPAKEGGENPRRVGTMRAAVGYGVGIHEKDPETVNRLVAKAIELALARGGLAAVPDAGAVFEVWVQKFWMDGSADYTADIEATMFLRRGSEELWRRPAKVQVHSAQIGMERPRDLFSRVFSDALNRFADEVVKAVKAPGFADALREAGRDVPAAAAGKGVRAVQAAVPRGVGLSVQGSGGVPGGSPKGRFQRAAQEALSQAGFVLVDGQPRVVVRYALDIEPGNGDEPGIASISTRLALRTATGRTLWEQWFQTRVPLDLAPGSTGPETRDAAVTQVIDREWRHDVAARLKSRDFATARAAVRE